MKLFVVFCIFLMLLLIAEGINAQLLNFNLVSGTNDISPGKINGITQDKTRYLWFVDQTKLTVL